jgi:tRNA threonylcarbamoyladenosine biosynthesis protein TsaE
MGKVVPAYSTSSPEETADLAGRLVRKLSRDCVLGLTGPLGSGKSAFVRGLARELGIPIPEVTSPTFTIINEYEGSRPLIHIDLYRLEGSDEIADLGLEEYFDGPGIVAVEWADRASSLLPPDTVAVSIERLSDREREICIDVKL